VGKLQVRRASENALRRKRESEPALRSHVVNELRCREEEREMAVAKEHRALSSGVIVLGSTCAM
jgi:hypothetical protein